MTNIYLITGFPGIGKSTILTKITDLLKTKPDSIYLNSLETKIPVEFIYTNSETLKNPYALIIGEKGVSLPSLDGAPISQRWLDQEIAMIFKDLCSQNFRVVLAESVRFASRDLLALIRVLCAEEISKSTIMWLNTSLERIVQQLANRQGRTLSTNPIIRSDILQQIKEFNQRKIMIPTGWVTKEIWLSKDVEKAANQILSEVEEIDLDVSN
ncbi:MAG: hypothetical protein ACFFDI_10655 [Promethearchaeota archaeon]